jgi:acyl-CoA synthetase (AMP-forming)/AMP-acid ligase II
VFVDYFDRGLALNPEAICLSDATGARRLTYREAALSSSLVAEGLRRSGLTSRARVAVYSPNDVTAFICVMGIMRAGMTWVAVNPKSDPSESSDLLDLTECEALLYHEALAENAAALAAQVASIALQVQFGRPGDDTFAAWMGASAPTALREPLGPDATAVIIGTGGTTGRPKAVPISNRQFMTMGLAFNAHMPEDAPPVYIVATPMTHAAGLSAFPVLAEGGKIVVHDGFHAGEIIESIEHHQVTRLFLPPTAIYMLLAEPGIRDAQLGSLRHFIYAAAPMSSDKLIEAIDVFGPVMTQTFGQAEAPMICTFMGPAEHADALSDPSKGRRLASCGRSSLVAAVELMDDDGRIVGNHERGEIVVRGDLVMRGYLNNPEATAEVRRPGGWHATGDIGFRDGDGYIYIVDRKRDMIISGGFNVYPSEVERVLWSHSAVLDCAVIGIPDEKWGEAVTAVVELKSDATADADELIALCKASLGSVQAPKSVLFRELPRSANGKVLKRVLRDEFWVGRVRQV